MQNAQNEAERLDPQTSFSFSKKLYMIYMR